MRCRNADARTAIPAIPASRRGGLKSTSGFQVYLSVLAQRVGDAAVEHPEVAGPARPRVEIVGLHVRAESPIDGVSQRHGQCALRQPSGSIRCGYVTDRSPGAELSREIAGPG